MIDRFCVNCQHCHTRVINDGEASYYEMTRTCTHPTIKRMSTRTDPVTGVKMVDHDEMFCINQREPDGHCRQAGVFFEQYDGSTRPVPKEGKLRWFVNGKLCEREIYFEQVDVRYQEIVR